MGRRRTRSRSRSRSCSNDSRRRPRRRSRDSRDSRDHRNRGFRKSPRRRSPSVEILESKSRSRSRGSSPSSRTGIERDNLIECPYNLAHFVTKGRFLTHLEKCRRNYQKEMKDQGKKVKIVSCRYNWAHQRPEPEIKSHQERCPDKYNLVPGLNSKSQDFKDKRRSKSRSPSPCRERPKKFRRITQRHYRQPNPHLRHGQLIPQINNFEKDIIGNPNFEDEDWVACTKETPTYNPDEKAKIEVPKPIEKFEKPPETSRPERKGYVHNGHGNFGRRNGYNSNPPGRGFGRDRGRNDRGHPHRRFEGMEERDAGYCDRHYTKDYYHRPQRDEHYYDEEYGHGNRREFYGRYQRAPFESVEYDEYMMRYRHSPERSDSPGGHSRLSHGDSDSDGPCSSFYYMRDGQTEHFNSDPETEWDIDNFDWSYASLGLRDVSSDKNDKKVQDPWETETICLSPPRMDDVEESNNTPKSSKHKEPKNTSTSAERSKSFPKKEPSPIRCYDWDDEEDDIPPISSPPVPVKEVKTIKVEEKVRCYDWEEIDD